MAGLTEWIRQLVLLVFVVSAAQLLLPADGMRPYVRFVLGLVIVSALLSSVLDLTSFRMDLEGLIATPAPPVSETTWRERGDELVAAAAEKVAQQGRRSLQRHVEETAALVAGPSFRRTEMVTGDDGSIRSLTVWLASSLAVDDAEGARVLGGLLGVEPGRIEFREEEERGTGPR